MIYPKEDRDKMYPPKQELPTWAIVLLSLGMVICIIIAIYMIRKSDESGRVRPL